jgi:signal transduction histidine kinase
MALRLNTLLARRHEHRVLALMLMVLHGAIWLDFGGAASRSLMLAHLGLFLLWQPIWRREERLAGSAAVVSVFSILAFVGWLDWGLITVWLVLLTGIVGGRMTEGRWERSVYMLTLIMLLAELLIGAIPPMFDVSISGLVTDFAFFGLPLLAVFIAMAPAHELARRHTQALDFLYGLTMSLLVSVLAMGSLLRMYDSAVIYPDALFQTVISLGAFLLAISWLWAPFAGFSGLGQLWTRYLMNIGTPFEQWLGRIAKLSERVLEPSAFLDLAMHELAELPWVKGASWVADDREGEVGASSPHSFSVSESGFDVTVYAHGQIGTALALHGRLLVGLLAHFYRAKTREVELTNHVHLEAVHETGARITHDIKNLLQSLYSLTSAIRSGRERDELLGLLERQLPALSQRLQSALDKLQAPTEIADSQQMLSTWWGALKTRHEGADITFNATLDHDVPVPVELFDSVAENLLENARYKQTTDHRVTITVTLSSSADTLAMTVSDTGAGVAKNVKERLLIAPVRSRTGLGIGLYQAARHAQEHGFRLRVLSSDNQNVAFELARLRKDESAADAAE